MADTTTAGPAENLGAETALPHNNGAKSDDALPGFILYEQLKPRVPVCDKSLREAIRKGVTPSVMLPGGRRRLFHWPSVEAALLRMQRGRE